MPTTTRTIVGAVIAATVALSVLTGTAAQGASTDHYPTRGAGTPLDERLAPDRAARPAHTPPQATEMALTALQDRIAHYVATHGTTYSFGSYIDPTSGRIVLETDASAEVVATLTGLDSADRALRDTAHSIDIRRTTTIDSRARRDDVSPFYGGGGIRAEGVTCSSGYAVRNSLGRRLSVTAGHCFSTGSTVTTESGAHTYGVVTHRRLPTATGHAMDAELIGDQVYAGRIFVGGVHSSRSIPVVSAGPAVVGYSNYCYSGRTTGERCGYTVTSVTAQVCTTSGCKSPVIAFVGGPMPEPGDSGSPFYTKNSRGAWIRGTIIASSSVTGWVQPWTTIASEFGVSIVTG